MQKSTARFPKHRWLVSPGFGPTSANIAVSAHQTVLFSHLLPLAPKRYAESRKSKSSASRDTEAFLLSLLLEFIWHNLFAVETGNPYVLTMVTTVQRETDGSVCSLC